ncbi:MAG TPA: cupin domain-containing protein [Blastocatellia bacterium]
MLPWTTEEQMQEMMALYALGALAEDEAWAMKNFLAENRNGPTEELKAFETIATYLAFAAPEQTPPLKIRQKLLAVAAQERRPLAQETFSLPFVPPSEVTPFFSLHADQGEWQEIGPGMSAKTLFADPLRGIVTSLVRMSPGTSLPPHKHLGEEQFFVLEGDCIVHGTCLGPGDFHHASAGSIHESTYTVGGTTFLLIAPANYEILHPVH